MPNNDCDCDCDCNCSKRDAKRHQQMPKDECGNIIPRTHAKSYSTGPIRPSQVCKYALCRVRPLSVTFL